MYATGTKKMLNMLILDILKEYSDENHRLLQQDIISLLDKNYGIDCERRTVKANIMSLKEMGYDISTDKGYYLMTRDFEDAELRLLIDSVLYSHCISHEQANRLIKKLIKQGNRYFNAKVKYVCNLPELYHSNNKLVMYNIDTINDAIASGKKISCTYNVYKSDKKLHPRREEKYVINPYQMVANNGRYYLIGNYDKYDNAGHYRIDKMTDVEILDMPVKPRNEISDFSKGYNLPKHMAERIYMFYGKSCSVLLKADKFMADALVDWFGKEFIVVEETADYLTVRVTCNKNAIICWALQYGRYVEVLEPADIRDEVMAGIQTMYDRYFHKY